MIIFPKKWKLCKFKHDFEAGKAPDLVVGETLICSKCHTIALLFTGNELYIDAKFLDFTCDEVVVKNILE